MYHLRITTTVSLPAAKRWVRAAVNGFAYSDFEPSWPRKSKVTQDFKISSHDMLHVHTLAIEGFEKNQYRVNMTNAQLTLLSDASFRAPNEHNAISFDTNYSRGMKRLNDVRNPLPIVTMHP